MITSIHDPGVSYVHLRPHDCGQFSGTLVLYGFFNDAEGEYFTNRNCLGPHIKFTDVTVDQTRNPYLADHGRTSLKGKGTCSRNLNKVFFAPVSNRR